MSLIAHPAKWIGPVLAVLVLSAAAALPLFATAAVAAAATAQQDADKGPSEEPPDPLAGTAQPVEKKQGAHAKAEPAPQPSQAPARPTTQPIGDGATIPSEPHASFQEPLFAERLVELAQNHLREKTVTEPMWRQAAALLEAATRLVPRDPRYHRLLIEARLKLGDTDGAIKALSEYRKADPADRVAQIQLIDLYAGQMQTADAKLEYLRDLLTRETVPPEVRSHVAATCVPLLMERSREEAMAMLDEALRLYPLSPEALRLRYEMVDASTKPAQRCAVLLTLLRSNPGQPQVIDELGDLLASAGLTKDAIEWYSVALRLYPRMGREYPDGFVSDLGSQLLLAGQNESLETLLTTYLKARPEDADAWFMRLVKEKSAGDKANPQVIEDARQALSARWSHVADRIAGRDPSAQPQPAAQPAGAAVPPGPGLPAGPGGPGGIGLPGPAVGAAAAGQPAPDPAEAVQRIKSGDAEQWKNALVNALSDLAWFELYFAEKPDAAAKWVAALKEVLPPDGVTVARLDGWLDVLRGKADDARAKLAPIADRDPLASLGLIRIVGADAKSQADADDAAAKLLADYPRGLIGAIVRTELRGRSAKPPERPEAAEVAAELKKFPSNWMEILNQPTAYYKINAEVLKVAHRYGEPLMARVTISNVTDYDITIGPNGVLRPDLWFDAKLGGLANQPFPGVAYDRIARIVVLPAHQGFGQLVRLDQGALGQTLAGNPSASMQVLASVVTNPMAVSEGVGPGPAGHRQAFKPLSRAGFPLSQPGQRKRVLAALESGPPAEKLRSLEMLAAYVQLIGSAKQMDEPMRAIGTEFASAMTQSRSDTVPVVAAYATYLTARLSSPDVRGELIERLAISENWPARLLGLIATAGMPVEKQLAYADKLGRNDLEPALKAFAAATADYLRSPAAIQPTTQPTTQPVSQTAPAVGAAAPNAAPAAPGVSVPSRSTSGAGGPGKRGG